MATKKKNETTAKTGVKAPAKKVAAKKAAKKTSPKTVTQKKPKIAKTVAKKTVAEAPAKKAATKKKPTKSTASLHKVKTKAVTNGKGTSSTIATKSSKTSTTAEDIIRLVVKKDVGFGNSLYIRGNAPGLSWDKGTPLENTSSDEWIWKGRRSTKAYEVKVLINDRKWDLGENTIIKGKKVTHYPVF